MSELRELYQELILDHGRHPRNYHLMPDATVMKEGFNPLCGDKVILFLKIKDDVIIDVSFQGSGCAISMASASLMTQSVKNKKITDAKKLFTLFQQAVTGQLIVDENTLGKLMVLTGVSEFPARVKCATLAWHTMIESVN